MKVLVIGPSWVGDMIMSQSLYRTLKALYPKITIDVIAPVWCSPLLSLMPEVNKSIPISINYGLLKIFEQYSLIKKLSKKFYSHAYVLPNSFKSALIPFFAKIPYRIGWRGEMRYVLLNNMRILNKKLWPLLVERYVALAYDTKVVRSSKDLKKPILLPQLFVSKDDILNICNIFSISSELPIIGLCPGAESSIAKRWPHYHYLELAKILINEGYQIMILGSVKDNILGANIFSNLNIKQQKHCYNLLGKTKLEQAVALIAICKMIITNDSGLMHVAAALNKPLVALYGPSSPNFTPPLSDKAQVIRLIADDYQQIYKSNCKKNYHQSLINISPGYVINIINNLFPK